VKLTPFTLHQCDAAEFDSGCQSRHWLQAKPVIIFQNRILVIHYSFDIERSTIQNLAFSRLQADTAEKCVILAQADIFPTWNK
jgi:hypothetical protein